MKVKSKNQIDKSGAALSKGKGFRDEVEYIELEDVFDWYRMTHLEPLSKTTIDIQRILVDSGIGYYIAQRLKRKPQIIRKLKRLNVRLTQLQDIGGCRIVVKENRDVDLVLSLIKERLLENREIKIKETKETRGVKDYRERGRDETGYRSLHVILQRDGLSFELQVRSRLQHYWAESIERTSVIYGYHLKEGEGDPNVIQYFKKLSDAFYEIESGRNPSSSQKIEIDRLKTVCENIISRSDRYKVFDSIVNEWVINTLVDKETRSPNWLNNWILVFDWNGGNFVTLAKVSLDYEEAVRSYVSYENQYPAENGYEVVLVGSSDVATIRQTHSHYFGIEELDYILENLDESMLGFGKRFDVDIGERQILACMSRKRFWGGKTVTRDTLKNHLCKNVIGFDSSLQSLVDKGFVSRSSQNEGYSLVVGRKGDIERCM